MKESGNDSQDMETDKGIHKSDKIEEKLAWVKRFGVTICYSKPRPKEYFERAIGLERREGITLSDDEIRAEANKWELSHGGISGRTAQQFVHFLLSQKK